MTAHPNRASSGRALAPVRLFPAVIIAALFLLFPAAEAIADIYLYISLHGPTVDAGIPALYKTMANTEAI